MRKKTNKARLTEKLESLARVFEKQLNEDISAEQKEILRGWITLVKNIQNDLLSGRSPALVADVLRHGLGKTFDARFPASKLNEKVDCAINSLWGACNNICKGK